MYCEIIIQYLSMHFSNINDYEQISTILFLFFSKNIILNIVEFK